MSLRARLVLLVLSLTVLLLGGLGLALAGSLRGWTEEVVDAELQRRAEVLRHEVHVDDGVLELDDDDDLATRGLSFRVERPTGEVLLGSPGWPASTPTGLGAATVEAGPGERVRVLSVAFTPHDGREPLVLRVAAPLGTVSGVAERFRTGLLLALLLAAVLGTAGAALLARTFLGPLQRLARDADQLEARSLTGRLDTAGLDPELGRLAAAFNGLLDRVAASVESQRAFIGRASHALRTPLASILAQGEVSLRRERTVEEYRAALEAIVATTRDAAGLGDALLSMSRADGATALLERERLALTDLGAELERLFRPRAEVSGLQLELDVEPGLTLLAAKHRLREVLDAVLDNAVRYTPRGGRVRLSARRAGDSVVFDVDDSGPGFAAGERELVFERFFRGSAADGSGQPGSGLGLSVVRALVEADGGTVALGGSPAGGARVTLTFPA